MSMYVSKSQYCLGYQCPKALWLKKNHPEFADENAMNQTVLDNGNMVGDLAMGYFGEHIEVPYNGDLGEMIAKTQELLEAGTQTICEASFAYEGLFCSVDILRNLGGGQVELVEVKSSTHTRNIYLQDIAFQYYVLTKLGYQVVKASLMYIDNGYIRQGALNLQQLFILSDVTETVASMQPATQACLTILEETLACREEPADDIGEHCSIPYACPFRGYCTRDLPKPNVFDLAGMKTRTQYLLYHRGQAFYAKLLGDALLPAVAQQQIRHTLERPAPEVAQDAVRKFLKDFTYPLYFLDFESFQPPIPLFDGSRPYAQIPFQYSLHILQEDGALEHREFLAEAGTDPRRALAECLCRDIPQSVTTVAYNMAFEKGRIKELAELYPDLAEHLMAIHGNMRDLMVPFKKRWYYCADMDGSYSIKYVLPALFPGDPELDYHNLEGVHKGDEASAAFLNMPKLSPEEQAKLRSELLKYCGLDTYAMVKLWQKLTSVC